MQTIKILTTQNVIIEYIVANIADRILATLIDYLIFIAYIFGIFLIFNLIEISLSKDEFIIVYIILYLPILFYDLICEIFLNGQSIGKKVLKIKVVNIDGTEPRVSGYLMRWLLRMIETAGMGSIAFITIILNGRGQRIGDIAAGTTVIKTSALPSLGETILENIHIDYKPFYEKAKHINDETISIIKELLEFKRKNKDTQGVKNLFNKADTIITNQLKIPNEQKDTELYFQTLLKDYNYYHGIV